MVTIEELLFRQGQLETEVLCLQDAVQRLAHRIWVLESFIKQKHGELALDETILLEAPPEEKDLERDPEPHEEEGFVTDFSEFFVPQAAILGASGQQFILTTASPKEVNVIDQRTHNVPDVKPSLDHALLDSEAEEEMEDQEDESVPDAVREETVSVNGANVNDGMDVYEGDLITGDLNLTGHGEEAVIYDVIPTSVSYQDSETEISDDIRFVLPPNKHAGTIRIYKPELKSFTRVSSDLEPKEISGVEKHQCSVCQKVFLRLENMERHLLLHTAVRFRCDECDRDFKNVHNLNLHKGKHQRLR